MFRRIAGIVVGVLVLFVSVQMTGIEYFLTQQQQFKQVEMRPIAQAGESQDDPEGSHRGTGQRESAIDIS